MKKILIFIIICFCLLLSENKGFIPKIGKLKDISTNKKVEISELYKNKNIIFNFWNLACIPCRKEMKHLNVFNKKYNEYNFEVISINMDTPRSLSKVKSFIKSKNYSFTVLNDPRSELFRKLGASIMPFTVLVDKNGNIISRHTGYNPGDELKLEKELIEILEIDSLIQSFPLDSTIQSFPLDSTNR